MSEPTLLRRLKERKLVQWALAYLAGAFVVFQGVEVMAEPWGISPTLQRSIHVLLLIGLFITLVLAWYHGEKGRQRVSGPELLMVAALLVIAGGVLSVLPGGEGGPEPATDVVTEAIAGPGRDSTPFVAVLPLSNLSGREEDAWFTDGMHGQILTQLSKIASLGVISSTSVQEYRESPKNLRTIGEEVGARYIAEGDVLRAGGDVRINIQLIDAAEDRHVWADTYDRPLSVDNLLSIQSEIAQEVARAVGAFVTQDEETRIEAIPTENLEAYDAYLLGRYHLGRRDRPREAFSQALRYFQLAVQQDPDLAVAHAGLAGAYASMVMWGHSDPRELWPLVEQWSSSALAIDSTVAVAHAGLAGARAVGAWDWEEAERGFQRANELSPSDADLLWVQADYLTGQGRIEEATEKRRIATSLDPMSSRAVSGQAISVFFTRRYEGAEALTETFLARDPGNTTAAWYLALASILDGRPAEAARFPPWDSATAAGWTPADRAHRAVIRGLMGKADSARFDLEHAVAGSVEEYVDPSWLWQAYAALGEKDEAFRWMERSIEVQSYHTMFLGVTPLADPLRDDPRYKAILDRIGLGHLKARFDSLAASAGGLSP
jgi:serine/threonine-protein kinase